jgi:hypothetical protein
MKHCTVKTYRGVVVQPDTFLTYELDEDEWSALYTGSLSLRERIPGTHWIGGWMNLTASLGMWQREMFLPLPGI